MRLSKRLVGAALVVTLVSTGFSVPAAAAPVTSAEQVVADLGPQLAVAGIPLDNAPVGSELFTLPSVNFTGVATEGGTVIEDDLVSYPRALPETDLLYGKDASENGAFIIQLRNAQASPNVSFTLDEPDYHVTLNPSGSITITTSTGEWAGTIDAPWAVDRIGQYPNSYFTVQGNTITQHIETTPYTVYPVAADPKFTWGWVTGTVYFNKRETGIIAQSTDWIYKLGIVIPGIWATVLRLVAEAVHLLAVHAKASGGCVKVKSTGALGIYHGGYCK